MGDEEMTALREELAEARAEAERLQSEAADGEARAAQMESQAADVQGRLAEAEGGAEVRGRDMAAISERTETLEAQVKGAAQRYREIALERSPELPEELVAGATVEEIDESIERARETVSKVRVHLESRAQAERVPVGAPPRSEPDLSAMSAEDKIKLGLQQQGA